MVRVVEQRKYIQDFLDFASTFLLVEAASVDEVMLVRENLKILSKRVEECCSQVKIGGKDGATA